MNIRTQVMMEMVVQSSNDNEKLSVIIMKLFLYMYL